MVFGYSFLMVVWWCVVSGPSLLVVVIELLVLGLVLFERLIVLVVAGCHVVSMWLAVSGWDVRLLRL